MADRELFNKNPGRQRRQINLRLRSWQHAYIACEINSKLMLKWLNVWGGRITKTSAYMYRSSHASNEWSLVNEGVICRAARLGAHDHYLAYNDETARHLIIIFSSCLAQAVTCDLHLSNQQHTLAQLPNLLLFLAAKQFSVILWSWIKKKASIFWIAILKRILWIWWWLTLYRSSITVL